MSEPIYIRLKSAGISCWHLVRISPKKWPLVKKLAAGEPVDVAQLGTILESGWGEPPQPVPIDEIDA